MNRLRSLHPSLPVVAILLALTAILRLINLTGSPVRLDDEGTYVAQAYAITQWGELAHYTYWYDHPPAGWLQLAAWMAITGPDLGGNAVVAGRYLMVIVAVLTAGLLWCLASRAGVSRWASAIAVLIYAVSPLSISLGRAVYLDNLAIAWVMAALVLISSPRHRLSAMFGAAACFGVAVLTKETVLLFVPMVVWLVWTKTVPATRRYALAVFGTVFAMVVSTYIVMAAVRGELIPGPGHVSLWQGIKFQLWERADGGSIADAGSLKRHTLTEWLQLDPALPLLAVPIAFAGLLIERLRPFAVGLATLIAIIVRPGYLPVPLIVSALPLTALLAAGVGEVALHQLRQADVSAWLQRLRGPALAAGVLVVSIVVSLWLPTYHAVLKTDDDASLQQAQQWIARNVPKDDRLIVDDAIWLDLVRDGRARSDVVWAYKVDTDEQVRAWAPHGWASYDWVVSTASSRANVPKAGVLTDAIAHAQPAATFGTGGTRVDVLRVNNVAPAPVSPAAPAFGTQLAVRLADSADPDALGILQSRTVDQRVLAALAVITATKPVRVEDIPAIAGEQIAGTPRREMVLSGPRDQLTDLAAFFQRQAGLFAVESATLTPSGLDVRFPLRANDIGLGAGRTPPQGEPAALRVADVRKGRPVEQVDLVRIDGTPAGSLAVTGEVNPSPYFSVPAGTYVLTTHAEGHTPVIRQVLSLNPAAPYTLTMFSGAESGEVTAQLAPDGPAAAAGESTLRLVNAAGEQGNATLALSPAAGGDPVVLANDAGYGLVTGYAPLAAGQYTAVITANGRESRQPVELIGGEPTSFLLTDGPDGPVLRAFRDVPDAPATLNPPALAMPPAATAPPAPAEKLHAIPRTSQSAIPTAAGVCIAAAVAALGLIRGLGVLALRRRGGR
jgi:hypothetical protein